MHRLFLITITIFALFACDKERTYSTELYSNKFDIPSDLTEWTIGFGEIGITTEESADQSQSCLEIFGWCATPNLSLDIGPYDSDYYVRIESWVKTQYGAAIHLNLNSNHNSNSDHVDIQTNEDLFKARNWTYYTSKPLIVPKGMTITLWIDASNNTLSYTWIDELRIVGEEY